MKRVKINYPKKKEIVSKDDQTHVVHEPVRKSMYDVILENLKATKRVTFLARLVYVGKHSGKEEDLQKAFENTIKKANETYYLNKLTGFLLCYKEHYIHMVEGDEDNIFKHLRLLFEQNLPFFGDTGTLLLVSHVNKRICNDWCYYSGSPPQLLEKLEKNEDFEDIEQTGRVYYTCLKKFFILVLTYTVNTRAERGSITEENDGESTGPTSGRFSLVGNMDKYSMMLPESELLSYILNSSVNLRVRDLYSLYGVVSSRKIYKDFIWPVPSAMIPYDVFEKPYDCLTELPTGKKSKFSQKGMEGLVENIEEAELEEGGEENV